MKVFVSGAGGFQGGSIAQAIIENKHEVISLKRNIEEGVQGQKDLPVDNRATTRTWMVGTYKKDRESILAS